MKEDGATVLAAAVAAFAEGSDQTERALGCWEAMGCSWPWLVKLMVDVLVYADEAASSSSICCWDTTGSGRSWGLSNSSWFFMHTAWTTVCLVFFLAPTWGCSSWSGSILMESPSAALSLAGSIKVCLGCSTSGPDSWWDSSGTLLAAATLPGCSWSWWALKHFKGLCEKLIAETESRNGQIAALGSHFWHQFVAVVPDFALGVPEKIILAGRLVNNL